MAHKKGELISFYFDRLPACGGVWPWRKKTRRSCALLCGYIHRVAVDCFASEITRRLDDHDRRSPKADLAVRPPRALSPNLGATFSHIARALQPDSIATSSNIHNVHWW